MCDFKSIDGLDCVLVGYDTMQYCRC